MRSPICPARLLRYAATRLCPLPMTFRPTNPSVRLGSLLLGWAACGLALAAAPTQPAAASSVWGELLGIVLPLALIILVLLAVSYFVRRHFGLTGRDTPLSIVQILPVGPRERIVLVKSRAGRLFAVGVSGQSVTLITNLDPSDLVAADAPPSESASEAISEG